MARLAVVLTLVLASANASLEVVDLPALSTDDACAADATSEECNLSLRQLRGQRESKPISKHTNSDPDDEESSEEEEETPTAKKAKATKSFTGPGFCCQDGAIGDVCNGCFEQSIVAEGDFCSTEDKCSGKCGGAWCKATCVLAGEDSSDWCMSAYPVSIANSSNICSKSAKNCAQCSGQWCQRVVTVDGSPGPKTLVTKVEPPKVNGICCYSKSEDTSDICGSCPDKAIAKNWNCARSEDACTTCQGTWCSSNTTATISAKVVPAKLTPAMASTTAKPEQPASAEVEQPDDKTDPSDETEDLAKVSSAAGFPHGGSHR